jgi:hypothetical protein
MNWNQLDDAEKLDSQRRKRRKRRKRMEKTNKLQM